MVQEVKEVAVCHRTYVCAYVRVCMCMYVHVHACESECSPWRSMAWRGVASRGVASRVPCPP